MREVNKDLKLHFKELESRVQKIECYEPESDKENSSNPDQVRRRAMLDDIRGLITEYKEK